MSLRFFLILLFSGITFLFAEHADTLKAHTALQDARGWKKSQPDRALKSYQFSFALFRQAQEEERALFVANEAGSLLLQQRKFQQAQDWMNSCRKQVSPVPSVSLGDHYHLLARILGAAGRNEKAKMAGLQAFAIREEVLPAGHKHISYTLINLGNTFTHLRNFDSTEWALFKALDNWKIEQDSTHPFVADCYNGLANAYLKQGDFPRAEQGYKYRLRMLTSFYDSTHVRVGMAWHNMGIYYERVGQYEEARDCYAKSLIIKRKHYASGHPELAKIYNSLGILALNEGNLARARQLQTQAWDIRMKAYGANHPLTGQSCNNLGNVYREMKEWKQAEKYLMQSYTIWSGLGKGYHNRVAAALNNLGNCAFDQKEYQRADSLYQEAYKHYESSDATRTSVVINRGLCAIKLGKPAEAITLLEKAMADRTALLGPDHPRLVLIATHIGEAYEVQNAYEKAIAAYKMGLQVLGPVDALPPISEWKAPKDRLACYTGLVRAYFALAKKTQQSDAGDNAWQYAQLGSMLLDSLSQQPWEEDTRTYWLAKGNSHLELSLEVAFWLAETHQDASWHKRAFPLAEQHKSILLAAHRQQIEALGNAGIPPSLQQRSRYLRDRIQFYQQLVEAGGWQGTSFSTSLAQEYRTRLFALKDSLQDFEHMLADRYPRYHAWKKPLAAVSPQKLQAGLDKEEGIWSAFCGQDALYLWGITSDGIKGSKFPKEAWPNAAPLAWLDSVRNADNWEKISVHPVYTGYYERPAHAWFQGLFESVFSKETFPERLTLVPDGWLALMPFDALVWEPKGGQSYTNLNYLLFHTELSFRFSLRTVETMDTSEEALPYVGFAPTYAREKPFLTALPSARKEVEEAMTAMGGKAYFGEEATEMVFRSNLVQTRILHLSGHARANDSLPGQSALYFSGVGDSLLSTQNDGVLHAYEIYEMDIPADIAVLSGCQTGSGRVQPGEGIMSMARAFAYAGCDQLVASLWAADDESTRAITQEFFAQLSEGKTSSEALNRAKRAFLANSPLSHPGYWAHLVHIEAYEAPAENSYLWQAVLGFMLLLTGGFAFYWLRKNRAVRS